MTDLAEMPELLVAQVGRRLREYRQAAGLSQTSLHEITGVGIANISRLERGLGNPTLEVLEALAMGLKRNAYELLMPDAE